MNCPYCMDGIPDAALVCKTCGRDLHLVNKLQGTITDLESKLAGVAADAAEASAAPQTSAPQAAPIRTSGGLEMVLAMVAGALLPGTFYDLRILFHLPEGTAFVVGVIVAGATGLLVGYRGVTRPAAWFVIAPIEGMLLILSFAVAVGCRFHAYYRGVASALPPLQHPARSIVDESPAWWVERILRNPHLWYSTAIPGAVLFLLLAWVGRSAAKRTEVSHTSQFAASLGRRLAPQRPQEAHESFQARMASFTKGFDGLTHVIVVLLGIVSTGFVVAKQAQALTSSDPTANHSTQSQ
jgi:hypothetical protein